MSSDEESEDYSGSEDGSGSESGSGSGSGSGSESGDIGSGVSDDESGSGSEEGEDETEDGDDGVVAEEAKQKLMAVDVAQLVELSANMDHVLNRIKVNHRKEEQMKQQLIQQIGGTQQGLQGLGNEQTGGTGGVGGGGGSNSTAENNDNGGENNSTNTTPRTNSKSQLLHSGDLATPSMREGGEENIDPNNNNDNNSQPGSRQSSHGKLPPGTPGGSSGGKGRDWDVYSHDSMNPTDGDGMGMGGEGLGGFFNNMGEGPGVMNAADLYKYREGGVGFGGGMDDAKRTELIGNAIRALLEDDDDE